MPIFILKFKDSVLREYPVAIGQTLTIGRNDSNDIVIDNMSVSGVHARIDSVSATFILTDLESTNGTFVNEKLISSHGLRNDDVIVIGKHTLIFDRSDLNKKPSGDTENNQDDNKTRYLDTSEYRELINKTTGQTKKPSPEPVVESLEDQQGNSFSRLLKDFFS